MPIAALAKYGELLVKRGILPPFGWSMARVPFAIELDKDGNMSRIVDLRVDTPMGKKMVKLSPDFRLPYRTIHTASVTPFFLADNLQYIFGICEDGKAADKVLAKNRAFIALHHKILDGVNTPKSRTILQFLDSLSGEESLTNERFAPYSDLHDDLLTASNIAFISAEDGSFFHEDENLMAAWEKYYNASFTDGSSPDYELGQCSITGEKNVPITRLHPAVTGVRGALSSGARLVSFNLPADDWYGKTQGFSAPVSAKIAESYGNALKYLYKNKHHSKTIGDTTYLFWAEDESDEELEPIAFSMALYGRQKFLYETEADEALFHSVNAMLSGSSATEEFANLTASFSKNFYLLGLKPHNARLAICLFQKNTLEGFFENAIAHSKDCAINTKFGVRTSTLYDISEALKNPAGKGGLTAKEEEAMVTAVLFGTPYPHTILNKALDRIYKTNPLSLDNNTSIALAGIIKAYLLRNGTNKQKEAATLELNTSNESRAYLLGVLFAHLVNLQHLAQGELNKSFTSKLAAAARTPARTFPGMLFNVPHYVKKVKRDKSKAGLGHWYEGTITTLVDRLGTMPVTLDLLEQGEFQLGYAHTQAVKYKGKKSDESDKSDDSTEGNET